MSYIFIRLYGGEAGLSLSIFSVMLLSLIPFLLLFSIIANSNAQLNDFSQITFKSSEPQENGCLRLIYCRYIMPLKKKIMFGTSLLTAAIIGLGIVSVNSITSVFASVEQSALQSVDLHLEECIKELQAGNTEGALTHCEMSGQELDPLLGNATG